MNKKTDDILASYLGTVEARTELAEAMIMPIIPPELREKIMARREALNKGCIEVKQERE